MRSRVEVPLAALNLAIVAATGSLGIALAAKFSQNRAVLSIIGAASIVQCILHILETLFLHKKMYVTQLSRTANVVLELCIMSSAVEFYEFSTNYNHLITSPIHRKLLVAFETLLLFSLFSNGLSLGWRIGSSTKNSCDNTTGNDYAGTELESKKKVKVKTSAQTLVPDMEIDAVIGDEDDNSSSSSQENWMQKFSPSKNSSAPNTRASSGTTSFPSVIKHSLISKRSEGRLSISKPVSTKKNRPKWFFPFSPFNFKSMENQKSEVAMNIPTFNVNQKNNKCPNLSTPIVAGLSAISSSSHSQIASDHDRNNRQSGTNHSTSLPLDHFLNNKSISKENLSLLKPSLDQSRLKIEKNEIKRINSALLPPILNPTKLQIDAFSNLQYKAESDSPVIDKVEQNYRNNVTIHQNHNVVDTPPIPYQNNSNNLKLELPKTITLDMWAKNKDVLMERAGTLQANALLPAFEFGESNSFDNESLQTVMELKSKEESKFKFPFNESQADLFENEQSNLELDNISELEQQLNDLSISEDNEMELFQVGLDLNHSSPIISNECTLKDLNTVNTRHSPTKSIVSIISSVTLNHQRHQSSITASNMNSINSHKRANSQASQVYRSYNHNGMASSPPPSPTRSARFRKFGKKLSLSNISDTMTRSFMLENNTNNNSEYYYHGKDDNNYTSRYYHDNNKRRGNSIDFSYVHSLQNNHSPTRSVNWSPSNVPTSTSPARSKSINGETTARTVSSLFYLQSGNNRSSINISKSQLSPYLKKTSILSPGNPSSSSSSQASTASLSRYPEVGMSEYDHERWNMQLSLDNNTEVLQGTLN